eukprot:Skav220694  [mRNA]  locus=scaffold472:421476:423095:- [translate_table: standard]
MPWMQKAEQVCSQVKQKRKKGRKKAKKATKELVQHWRDKAGSKPQATLVQEVVPHSSKGKQKAKQSAKHKLSVLKKKKAKQLKKDQAAQKAKAWEKQQSQLASWVGQAARVTGETAPGFCQGEVVLVLQVKDSQLLCQRPSGQKVWISQLDLEHPIKEAVARQAMEAADMQAAAWAVVHQAGKLQIDVYEPGTLLTDDQLQQAWLEVEARLKPGSSVRVVTPAESELAAQQGVASQAMKEFLADSHSLLLVPVHSYNPQHWTLLSVRKAGSGPDMQPEVSYFESLSSQPEPAKEQARKLLKLCCPQADLPLPEPKNRAHQSDGFSCGFWAVQYMERQARQFLNCSEGRWQTVKEQQGKLMLWQKALQKQQRILQAAQKEREQQAGQQESLSAPPLPPPEGPPPEEEPGRLAFDSQYGCSKCRYASTGCLSRNPAKMLRWANKTEQERQKAEKKAQDLEQTVRPAATEAEKKQNIEEAEEEAENLEEKAEKTKPSKNQIPDKEQKEKKTGKEKKAKKAEKLKDKPEKEKTEKSKKATKSK